MCHPRPVPLYSSRNCSSLSQHRQPLLRRPFMVPRPPQGCPPQECHRRECHPQECHLLVCHPLGCHRRACPHLTRLLGCHRHPEACTARHRRHPPWTLLRMVRPPACCRLAWYRRATHRLPLSGTLLPTPTGRAHRLRRRPAGTVAGVAASTGSAVVPPVAGGVVAAETSGNTRPSAWPAETPGTARSCPEGKRCKIAGRLPYLLRQAHCINRCALQCSARHTRSMELSGMRNLHALYSLSLGLDPVHLAALHRLQHCLWLCKVAYLSLLSSEIRRDRACLAGIVGVASICRTLNV